MLQGSGTARDYCRGKRQFTAFGCYRGQLQIDACNAAAAQLSPANPIETPHVPALAVEGGGQIDAQRGFRRPDEQLTVAVNGGGQIDARDQCRCGDRGSP